MNERDRRLVELARGGGTSKAQSRALAAKIATAIGGTVR
jgi:hypothetical protein